MMALVKVESGGNPLAINVNGKRRLARQPKSKQEALAWSEWLINRGYSVDMGLTQVNSANLPKLRTTTEALFDPCANLAAGARILVHEYAGAAKSLGAGQDALRAALSAYNTGNRRAGIRNGYVAKVTAAAQKKPRGKTAPPLVSADSTTGTPRSPRVFLSKQK
ncbi:MAG: lytic transglycosylase domain-containing protein [Burkholderiaceae bacterium]|nr:lytic transglycosylase domain-containing protein [Burkholderiaceae bacterium]